MYLDKCIIIEGDREECFHINEMEDITLDFYNNLQLIVVYRDSNIEIKLVNQSNKNISLNQLAFRIKNIGINSFTRLIVNTEKNNEMVLIEEFGNKYAGELESNLFTVLISDEETSNFIFGFLGCRSSRNYFKVLWEKDEKDIYAVYDFINQELMPGAEFELDSIHRDSGHGYVKLLDNYVKKINNRRELDLSALNKVSEYKELFFTSEPIEYSLRDNEKLIYIVIKKKKKYLVDIRSQEGKRHILDVIHNITATGENLISFNHVGQYVSQIQKLKLFNVYYEISNILDELWERYKEIKISFDDCPIGIFAGRQAILQQKLQMDSDKKSFFQKLKLDDETKEIHYSLIIKLILQKLIIAHNTTFITRNKKSEELINIITGSIQNIDIRKRGLFDVKKDIYDSSSLTPYLCKREVLGLYIRGKCYCYIAIFNLASKHAKFFWDLSSVVDGKKIDGNAIELYSNKSITISDNTVYIRDIRPGDCMLIQKSM